MLVVRIRGRAGGAPGRFGALLALALIAALGWAGHAQAESRLALVIGNSAYAQKPLANPRNDAELMRQTLEAQGFAVTALVDADQVAMRKAILEFGRQLRDSDSVGLFYYAGHGVQVDGENYLIPTGADIRDLEDVALNGINLTELLRSMERSESRLNIAILDACRDNPFASRTRSASRGLAAVEAPAGTLIAYATAPGRVSYDGTGENSPYTVALAANIPTEGAPLEDVFRRTRRKVLEVTGGKQTPWEHSSLTGEFFFKPKIAAPETSSARDGERPMPEPDKRLAELQAWDAIKSTTDVVVLKRHLDTYPNGVFSELVSIKIAAFEEKANTWSWVVKPAVADTELRDAEAFYEEALKLDHPAATSLELVQAVALYRRAAEMGMPAAMHGLARAYDKGRGIERNTTEAAAWYKRAADKGHAGAMASLGTMYEFGEGVGLDMVEAIRLYRQSAEAGDANGMTSLAYLYAEGKGLDRDAAEARRWYGKAVSKGNLRAMFNLALMHMQGLGGSASLPDAVRLLRSAAGKGHAGAMRERASLYDEGRGVPRDPKLAARHLLAAYKAGEKQARLDIFERPERWSFSTRREVQKQLAAKGLYSGQAHGIFNAQTRRALDRLALQD